MSSLDRLIASSQRKALQRHFIPFQVFYLYCHLIKKPKYLLLVCDNPLLFLYINSDININMEKNPIMQHSQIPLYKEEAYFMSNDLSFINCKEIVKYMTKDVIIEQISRNDSRIKGVIDTTVQKKVIMVLKEPKVSKLIPKRDMNCVLNFIDK